jgi:O-antigen ligase
MPFLTADRQIPTEWIALAAALGVALSGAAAGLQILLAGGVAAAGLLAIVACPEALVALFLAAGTLKANPAFSAVPADFTLLTAAAVAVAMLIRVLRDGMPPVPRAAALFPLLLVLMLLSVLWSPAPEIGFLKAKTFETLTLISFACPFILLRTRAQVERFMVAMVGVGLFIALTAVNTGHPAKPLVAAGGNEIELALYAAWGMLAALGYLLLLGRSPLRALWIVPAALLSVTVVQAGSRGVLVGAVLAIVFLTGQAIFYQLPGRGRLLATVAAATLVAALIGDQLAAGASYKYTHYLLHANLDSVLISREWILARGWELSIAHPFGLGAGGFQWATGWEHSHNMFFEIASEQGMVALGIVVALIASAWRTRLRGPGGHSPESAICGALIVVFLVQALVTNGPNDSRPLWFTLGLALALPQLRGAVVDPSRAVRSRAPASAAVPVDGRVAMTS